MNQPSNLNKTNNNTAKLMHLVVLHELNKMNLLGQTKIQSIAPEKTVLLEKNGKECQGRFDFLVKTKSKLIGIEVITRPTKGKLKEKLPYTESVDEFVFVLPENSMQLYRKRSKKIMKELARASSFPKEFNNPKLFAWLLEMPKGKIREKARFNRLFNVK